MTTWYHTETRMPDALPGIKPEPWELIGFFSQHYGKSLKNVPDWIMEVWTMRERLDYSARPNSLHLLGDSFYYRIDYQTVQAWVSNPGGKEVDFYIYRRPR